MLKSVPSEEFKDALTDDSSDSSEYFVYSFSDAHYWNNSSNNYMLLIISTITILYYTKL
jgi:hypothetical protein